MVTLQTARLLLREFAEDDWPAIHAVESLPEVARYQNFDARTEAESRAYVREAIEAAQETPRETWDLALVELGSGTVIGRCGFAVTNPEQREAVLWYTLHPDHWGQGYTTEAAVAALDFAFGELRLHRVWAECDPRNTGSWRVLEKAGMRREGHLVENVWLKGEWCDSLLYAVLGREWGA
ncbi:MAG: GNAT family protein [Thermomicrobiales bacterium]